ncbi:hypothetical protein C8Q77DRAFT_807914 [Trametes polyzona]|nr:hypothetical protein C8Q77DRAFT_807914 [Trametes polyzona]
MATKKDAIQQTLAWEIKPSEEAIPNSTGGPSKRLTWLTLTESPYNPGPNMVASSAICSSLLSPTSVQRNIDSSQSHTSTMAPTSLTTSPNSDSIPMFPPALQVTVLFSIVSLVLRHFGSRVSFTGTAQSQATLPVHVELQADALGSVFVRRSRFWWLSSLFRRLRFTSCDTWLDFTATLTVLGRGTSVEFLPLPVSSRRASSFSVSVFVRKLFGRPRRLTGRIPSVVVVVVVAPQLELRFASAWVPCGVVLPVVQANIKFAPTKTLHHTHPSPQTPITPPPQTTTFDYTFPCDPPGVTPSGVG